MTDPGPPTPPTDPDAAPAGSATLRHLWVAGGVLSLGLGLIGIVLPVLPTTPLILLAAFCFSKGSPRLRAWITAHARFGPIIEDWEETGAIPRPVKLFACTVMAITFGVSVLLGLPAKLLIIQGLAMSIGAAYVLTRPDR